MGGDVMWQEDGEGSALVGAMGVGADLDGADVFFDELLGDP